MPELWDETDNVIMTAGEVSQFKSSIQSAIQNITRAIRLLEAANRDRVYSQELYELQDLKPNLANQLHDVLVSHEDAKM
jgi:hypothetical protein